MNTSVDPVWGQATFVAEHEGVKYKGVFNLVGKVPMHELMAFFSKESPHLPHRAVGCLDIILRTNPLRAMIYTGKVFAIAPQGDAAQGLRLGQGCQAWCFFCQAFKRLDTGLYLSFDVAHRAFYIQQTVFVCL